MSGGSLRVGGDEALEQQGVLVGLDGGDAERVAQGGVGRRAAALAQDLLGLREADDLVDREEVGRVAEPRDQPELVRDLLPHVPRRAAGPALQHGRRGAPAQRLLRRQPLVQDLVRVLVGQVAHGEAAGRHDAHRRVHRVLVPGEEASHLGFRLQVRLGVGRGGEAERVDRGAEADGGQHVGQAPPVRVVEADAAGGEQRRAGRARHRRQEVEALAVVPAEAVVGGAEQGQGEAAAERRGVAGQAGGERRVRRFGRQQRHHQPVRVLEEVVAGDAALAFRRFHPALGEQPREPAVGGAVRGPGEVFAAVVRQADARAGDEAELPLRRRDVAAHQTRRRSCGRRCRSRRGRAPSPAPPARAGGRRLRGR